MCGSKKEMKADNTPPAKKPLLAGEKGYTGEPASAAHQSYTESLPEADKKPASYTAPRTAHVITAASHNAEFLSLLRKPDSGSKETSITTALTQALEKGAHSPEARKILASIKEYVRDYCATNIASLDKTIGSEGNNFLHKLSFAISKGAFSRNSEVQKTIFDFISKNYESYFAELIVANAKSINPLSLSIALSQTNIIDSIFSNELPDDFEQIAQVALTRSKNTYIGTENNSIKGKQLEIGLIIATKFPHILGKVLADSMIDLPASIDYAKMLLAHGANPIIKAHGQSNSAWDYAWKVFNDTSPSKAASKEAAKEILKCALESPAVKTTVASIQAEFPFLVEELRAGTPIDIIISNHPEIGDKALYLKKGVYHFLLCVKDFAPTLTGSDSGFIASLKLPLLQAIPEDNQEHASMASGFTAGTMRTGVNLPIPSASGSVVYDDASDARSFGTLRTKAAPHTAIRPLASLVEAEQEVDSPAGAPAGVASSALGLALGNSGAFSNYGGHKLGSINRVPTPPKGLLDHSDDVGDVGALGALSAHAHHDGAFE